ncbi:leucine-rich repeat lipoprotein MbfN [Mycoplasmopsis agalactiae]|uniref:leucine-rich repeat lipoprotein MbfN n=1 Tax=Mycoplasmopsis agalactiae TaxID=2110 RepID=UPI001F8A1D05|nr:leucine-rich repeat domain-containing protein [Mycoplasmopsis agalactiae]MCE6115131.1 leucine-rich repeat domain-containing protein [Mycoplasmopsis agalactiae]
MKKFGLVLLPILTFPAIAAACDNKDKVQKDSNNPGTENIDPVAAELQKLKDELQDEITKAYSKRNHYLGDYTDYAFEQSAKVIQEAVDVHHDAKTTEEVKEAIAKLKAGIKEIDSYYALSREEKQKRAKDDFNKALADAKAAKAKLTKPSALEVLDNSIAKAESNKEGDPHYFKNLLQWTHESRNDIKEAQKLEEKTDEELLMLYLDRESNILNTFNREYNASGSFEEQAKKLEEIFKKAKENKKENYKEQEIKLRKEISEILEQISKEAITPSKANELAKLVKNGELIIGDEYKYILSDAFAGNRKIKKVTLGKKIEKIERGAFDNSAVETITFNDDLKSLKGFSNTKVKELTLPKKLEKFAGFNGTKITKLVLPKTLKSFALSSTFLEELEFESNFEFNKVSPDSYYESIAISKQLLPSLKKILVADESAKKNLLEKLKKIITYSKKIELGKDYIKYLAYIVNVKIVKKFTSIKEDQKRKIMEALKEALKEAPKEDLKEALKKDTESEIENLITSLNNGNLKSVLEKVLDSYKYEKISAKHKFEVFDAAISTLVEILNAINFELKTETIKNDPDLTQYHHETGVTPGEITNYFDSEKKKYEDGKNGNGSNEWEEIIEVKKAK